MVEAVVGGVVVVLAVVEVGAGHLDFYINNKDTSFTCVSLQNTDYLIECFLVRMVVARARVREGVRVLLGHVGWERERWNKRVGGGIWVRGVQRGGGVGCWVELGRR